MRFVSQFTLSPQVPRYTNGAPDLGYYYAALDYNVASVNLAGGSLTVLPGTAVGFCNGSYTNSDGNSYWTLACFHLTQGATITSHGTPNQPIVFVAADLVQETPNLGFAVVQVFYSRYYGDWLPGLRAFMIDAEPGDAVAPGLDFRFCQFYLPADDLHFAAGEPYDNFWWFKFSPDSEPIRMVFAGYFFDGAWNSVK